MLHVPPMLKHIGVSMSDLMSPYMSMFKRWLTWQCSNVALRVDVRTSPYVSMFERRLTCRCSNVALRVDV